MPSPSRERLLRGLCRIYGWMLLAYPSAFRRAYGREMAVVFRDRARDVVESESSLALMPFVLRIGWDWFYSALRENNTMTSRLPALQRFVVAPLAILATYGALRIVATITPRGFPSPLIRTNIAFFLLASAIVSAGVWVAPTRKDSLARVALSLVVFWGALRLGF